MPSSIVVSRKRKADVLEADGTATDGKRKSAPDDDSPAHLPAPCLAAVLNFMWYTDVRQCMLAGKMMAVEAARHVETLNITKASELVVPAARRFGNASEVNVLCLVSEIDEDDEENTDDQISMDTVARVIPFLASFPSLARVFLGGLYLESDGVWGRYKYNIDDCKEPRDHRGIFKTLIQVIIGGFQSKSLPQSLRLGGILDGIAGAQLECAKNGREDPDHPCQLCRHVLSSFPLPSLLTPVSRHNSFCVSHVDRIRDILRRADVGDTLRSNDGAEMLLSCLTQVIPWMTWKSSKSEVDEAFLIRMRNQGARMFAGNAQEIGIKWNGTTSNSESLKQFLDLVNGSSLLQGIIKSISRKTLIERHSHLFGVDGGKTIFVCQVFEALLEAGLNLNKGDYIIVDPAKEPALAPYLARHADI